MATVILGLFIEVVGCRSVEPPAGHTYASQKGKAANKGLGRAHNFSATPIFASGAGQPIHMSYCGRGTSRDVWEGDDRQLGGRAVLKICNIEWELHQHDVFEALRTLQGRIRVPQPLWLGRASIYQIERSCLLAASGDTDAEVALRGCLRSEDELQNVAQWAVGFLDRAIDFLTVAVQQGVFPGNDWTLRQCCVRSPVPGPPSELVLVDAEAVENSPGITKLPSKLKHVCTKTVEEFLVLLRTAPRPELRSLADFMDRACQVDSFYSADDAVAKLKSMKARLLGGLHLWKLQLHAQVEAAEAGNAGLSTRGLSQDSWHWAAADAATASASEEPQRLPLPPIDGAAASSAGLCTWRLTTAAAATGSAPQEARVDATAPSAGIPCRTTQDSRSPSAGKASTSAPEETQRFPLPQIDATAPPAVGPCTTASEEAQTSPLSQGDAATAKFLCHDSGHWTSTDAAPLPPLEEAPCSPTSSALTADSAAGALQDEADKTGVALSTSKVVPANARVSAATTAAAATAGPTAPLRKLPLSRSPFSPNFVHEETGVQDFGCADSWRRGRRRGRDRSRDDRHLSESRGRYESPEAFPSWYGHEAGATGGAWSNQWQGWWQHSCGQQWSQAWTGSWPAPNEVAWAPTALALPQSQPAIAYGNQELVSCLRPEAKATMQEAVFMMIKQARRGFRTPGDPEARTANRQRRQGAGHAERRTQVEMDMASLPLLARVCLL